MTPEEALERARAILVPLEEAQAAGTLEAKLARSSSRAMLLRELERVLASVRRSK